MANNLLTKHGDERQGERISVAQRIDDERLGPIAEREPGEGAGSKGADHIAVSE